MEIERQMGEEGGGWRGWELNHSRPKGLVGFTRGGTAQLSHGQSPSLFIRQWQRRVRSARPLSLRRRVPETPCAVGSETNRALSRVVAWM